MYPGRSSLLSRCSMSCSSISHPALGLFEHTGTDQGAGAVVATPHAYNCITSPCHRAPLAPGGSLSSAPICPSQPRMTPTLPALPERCPHLKGLKSARDPYPRRDTIVLGRPRRTSTSAHCAARHHPGIPADCRRAPCQNNQRCMARYASTLAWIVQACEPTGTAIQTAGNTTPSAFSDGKRFSMARTTIAATCTQGTLRRSKATTRHGGLQGCSKNDEPHVCTSAYHDVATGSYERATQVLQRECRPAISEQQTNPDCGTMSAQYQVCCRM